MSLLKSQFTVLVLLCFGCESESEKEIDTSVETSDPVCEDNGSGALPSGAEWISLDGNSTSVFSLAQEGQLSTEWQGNHGIYDLNTVGFEGANGFRLSRPGIVVGASVQWSNLSEDLEPVSLYFWPDFGSDGYMWDTENPYTQSTRCMDSSMDGEWVEYVLNEPIRVDQPFHVFAGYKREARESNQPSLTPEIYMENFQMDAEPYFSGARFFGVDDQTYYLGMSSPWYTWRVRLAVIYDEEIPAEDKPFQIDPELTASSRVAWGDFDNDGDDDLMTSGPILYRNNGDGTFNDINATNLFTAGGSNGGVWGDYNNDGCLDFFGQGTTDILLKNSCNADGQGYILSDVTVESGIHDIQSTIDCNGDGLEENSPTEGSGWVDFDNDGFLDIYMANYECSSEHDFFQNYTDRFWRNNGDGSFTEWSSQANVPAVRHAGRGVTTGDYDQDGDTDIFVSNYRLDPNFFLENQGDGTFDEIAAANGTKGVYVTGAYGHTIGSVFGDIDNDGDFDLVQANLAHPFFYSFSDRSAILINDGTGNFEDQGVERGLYFRETHSNPTLFDADNDGDLDLFITCVYSNRDSDFYINDGDGNFTLSNHENGLLIGGGWGSATADFDQDGDLDLIAYDLFRNDNANGNNWLKIRPIGGVNGGPLDGWLEWKGNANTSAIGAVITVVSGDKQQLRQVSGGSGTGVQDSLTQHFGLGSAENVESINVLFPGGTTLNFTDINVNQTIWIHEDGSMTTGSEFPENFIPGQ